MQLSIHHKQSWNNNIKTQKENSHQGFLHLRGGEKQIN